VTSRTVAALTPIAPGRREALRQGLGHAAAHARHFAAVSALHEIETGGVPAGERATGPIPVAVWNLEQVRHPAASAALLGGLRPDVALLSEIDDGMARSGNRHGQHGQPRRGANELVHRG
jgi:hypothetical protein